MDEEEDDSDDDDGARPVRWVRGGGIWRVRLGIRIGKLMVKISVRYA